MRKIAALLAVLALGLAPSAASAHTVHHHKHRPVPHVVASTPHVDTNPITTAMAAAAEYWHGTPCGGNVRVEAEAGTEVQTVTHSPYGALTSMMTSLGPNQVSAPPSTYTDCVVRLSSEWRDWGWDDQEYEDLCVLTIHEYSHLEGYGDPGAKIGTVEYEDPTTAPLPKVCQHYRLHYYEHGQRPDVYEYEPGSWEGPVEG